MDYRLLIKEICEEENVDYKLISKKWVMVLTKDNITKCISGYRFPLNDYALGSVIDDKYAFYDLCKLKNIPIIEYNILFNPNSNLGNNTYELIDYYYLKYNEDVVIKPNMGTEENDVYHITDKEELIKVIDRLFKSNFSISICPFYKIDNEYRVVVLNNQVELIFEKNKLVVISDGIKTIKELLIELNPYYFKKINLDEYNTILNKNELFEYDWRFNLSKGATANIVTDKLLYNKLSDFALDVVKKINGKFLSIDIIKCINSYYLMEANSAVCINKVCNFIDKDLSITKEIYRKAIKSMFE